VVVPAVINVVICTKFCLPVYQWLGLKEKLYPNSTCTICCVIVVNWLYNKLCNRSTTYLLPHPGSVFVGEVKVLVENVEIMGCSSMSVAKLTLIEACSEDFRPFCSKITELVSTGLQSDLIRCSASNIWARSISVSARLVAPRANNWISPADALRPKAEAVRWM